MDEEQVRVRLQAIEEERRQLQREQDEEEGGASASAAAAAAAATTATSSTRRQLWALAMEMAQEQQEQQQQPQGLDDEEAEEELSTLRESVRLLEAVTAVAALPAPASLTGAAGAAGPLVLRLPSLVEQHLAACGHLEALLQAEQRARRSTSSSSSGGGGGRGIMSSSQQQQLLLLGALLRLVRGQGRALRERILWAVHNQALSFPFPQQEGATPAVAACVHRRPRRSGGTTSGLLPLFLALKRLQTHAAANPLPLNVTEDPLQRRRVGSPKSPRGGAARGLR